MKLKSILALILGYGFAVHAAPKSKSKVGLKQVTTSAKAVSIDSSPHAVGNELAILPPGSLVIKKQNSDKIMSAQIRFENLQYFKEIAEAPQLTSNNYLSARMSLSGELESFAGTDFSTDISASTTFLRGQTNFMFHEAYLQPDPMFGFGRKRMLWSEMDSRYRLGLWEPTYALDLLRPEPMGLTGLFIDYSKDNFQVVALVSPLFIPSIGPDIREENGALVSESRWYRRPSTEYLFSGNMNSITYNLDIPQISKLILNPTAAAMVKLGNRNRGWWGMGSVGYKPMNDILLERQNFKNATSAKLDVKLRPAIGFHSIFSADVGFVSNNWAVSTSYLEDSPIEKSVEKDWITQFPEGLRALSVTADFTLSDIFRRTINLQMGYLDVAKNKIQDRNSDGTKADFDLFSYRFRYGSSWRLSLDGEVVHIQSKPLVARFQYLYDYSQRGSVLSSEFMYQPQDDWSIIAGVDLLGVDDESRDPYGFINQFRANDRWFGGVSYVF